MSAVLDARRAGVLLHISALPADDGPGDFSAARAFVDFLVAAGISVWQVLPLGPTHRDLSPYLCTSSLAGNPMFIDGHQLRAMGWLSADIQADQFDDITAYRRACLKQSVTGFNKNATAKWQQKYQHFVASHNSWLNDFALFTALWRANGGIAWMDWPAPLRDRDPHSLQQVQQQLAPDIEQAKFEQFIFFQQWLDIKAYANQKGLLIFGDLPIYLAHDSAEIWVNREFFKVDAQGNASVVAGVPPDYFSATGQIWGNPVYNWPRLQTDGFRWWINRLKTQLELCDLLRIDHFRALQAYWEIPANANSAESGCWQPCPGFELLQTLQQALGRLPLIAEDLGFITSEVHQLREHFALPGMKVTQFAFDGSDDNPYLLRHHIENCVAYTGTHDNDTSLAWYQALAPQTRRIVNQELGLPDGEQADMPWALIDYTLSSCARLVVLPMQDILSLGQGHRLNTPGTIDGNWTWQFSQQRITDALIQRIRTALQKHQRLITIHRDGPES